MALRPALLVSLCLRQTKPKLPVSAVWGSRLYASNSSNDNSSSGFSSTHQSSGQSKWTIPLGLCLTAVGTSVALMWNNTDHQLIPTVTAAERIDGSGSGSNRQSFNFVADVVEKVAPSVVSIHTARKIRGYGEEISCASGFIVSSDGLIVTNAHAVHNTAAIQVTVLDGRTFEARVETMDQKTDLATIRIPAKNLPVLKLGSSDSLRSGEWVISIGSPAGLSNSVSCGVVSTVGRRSAEFGGDFVSKDMEYIQTDASINQGNSGGPLVNLDGEAVGVNTYKLLHGISFAIPSKIVKEFLDDPAKPHTVSPKTRRSSARNIGITCLTLTPYLTSEIARHFNVTVTSQGVYIVDVHLHSPAMRAGLKPGDTIVAVNNKPIKSTDELYEATVDKSEIYATILRDSKEMRVKLEFD